MRERCPPPENLEEHKKFWETHYCVKKDQVGPYIHRGYRMAGKSSTGRRRHVCCPSYSRLVRRTVQDEPGYEAP